MREVIAILLEESRTLPSRTLASTSSTTADSVLSVSGGSGGVSPVPVAPVAAPTAAHPNAATTTDAHTKSVAGGMQKILKNKMLVPCVLDANSIDWRAVETFRRHCLPAMTALAADDANADAAPESTLLELQQGAAPTAGGGGGAESPQPAPLQHFRRGGKGRTNPFLQLQYFKCEIYHWIAAEIQQSGDLIRCSDTLAQSRSITAWCDRAFRQWKAAEDLAVAAAESEAATNNAAIRPTKLDPTINGAISPGDCHAASRLLVQAQDQAKKAHYAKLMQTLERVHYGMLAAGGGSNMRSEQQQLDLMITQVQHCLGSLVTEGLNVYRQVFEMEFLTAVKSGKYAVTFVNNETDTDAMWEEMSLERAFATKILHKTTVMPYLAEILSSRLSQLQGLLKGKLQQFIRDRSPDFGTLFGACTATKELQASFYLEFEAIVVAECHTVLCVGAGVGQQAGKLSHRLMEVSAELKQLVNFHAAKNEKLLKLIKKAVVSSIQQWCPSAPKDGAQLITTYLKKALRSFHAGPGTSTTPSQFLQTYCKCPSQDASFLMDLCSCVHAAVDSDALAEELKQLMLRRLLGGGSALVVPTTSTSTYSSDTLSAEFAVSDFFAKQFGAGRAHHMHMLCEDMAATNQLQTHLDQVQDAASVRVLNVVSTPVLMVRPLCSSLQQYAETTSLVYAQMFPKRKLSWLPTMTQLTVLWRHERGEATVVMSALHLELLEYLAAHRRPVAASAAQVPEKIAEALDLNAVVAQKHLQELTTAGLVSPSSLSGGLCWVSVSASHATTSCTDQFIVVGKQHQQKAAAPSSGSTAPSSMPPHKRRVLLDSALVRLLKQKGTARYPLAPQLQPLMNTMGAGTSVLTKTEIDACVDRMCQREYARLEACGERLSYVA